MASEPVSGDNVVYGRTEKGQFFYDVVFSNKKISYLERKWKMRHLRLHRLLGRAIMRGDRKAQRFWSKRLEAKRG